MRYLVLVGGGQDADVAVVARPVLVLEHPHGAVLLLLHLLPPGAAGGQEGRMEGGDISECCPTEERNEGRKSRRIFMSRNRWSRSQESRRIGEEDSGAVGAGAGASGGTGEAALVEDQTVFVKETAVGG